MSAETSFSIMVAFAQSNYSNDFFSASILNFSSQSQRKRKGLDQRRLLCSRKGYHNHLLFGSPKCWAKMLPSFVGINPQTYCGNNYIGTRSGSYWWNLITATSKPPSPQSHYYGPHSTKFINIYHSKIRTSVWFLTISSGRMIGDVTMTMMAIEYIYIFVVGVCLISLFWQCHPSSIITLSIAAAALKSMANKSSSFVEVPIIKLIDKANVLLRPYEYWRIQMGYNDIPADSWHLKVQREFERQSHLNITL